MTGMRVDTLAPPAGVTTATSTLAVARAGLWILLTAKLVAGWGVQWDIQWHVIVGRDSFWIPPHVMTYGGISVAVLVSFGVLLWTTVRSLGGGVRQPGAVTLLGLTATRGYHLAAWGIALTVLAAPIDDLWHRRFGIDVTLWSPPHLLGLLGAVINSAAGWLIAREVYPVGSRARLAAMVLAGALVYGGIAVTLQPALRMAYVHGGIAFYTYPILAALLVPLALVITARVSDLRAAPLMVLVLALLIGFMGAWIARAGFAWMQPVSVIEEEIAKDPTSPIAVAHTIARKNQTTPGSQNATVQALALIPVLLMTMVDARRRPVLATLVYGLALFVVIGAALARLPAFQGLTPSAPVTAVAALLTALAALAGGALARGPMGGRAGAGAASPGGTRR